MLRYVGRRVVLALVVVVGVVVLTFLLTRLIPGDPALSWAGPRASGEEIARAREFLGLNRPLPEQIGHFFGNLLQGDLGTSIRTRRAVLDDMLQAIPASLGLIVPALALAVAFGIPLGLTAARFSGRWGDVAARLLSIFAVSMPVFWLALILQLVFFQWLRILPVAGEYAASLTFSNRLESVTGVAVLDALLTGNWPVFGSALQHMVLPALTLAAWPIGVLARLVRATVVEVSTETHMQMVRALGFSEWTALGRFGLRLSLGPVIQVLALIFAYTLTNTFLVEAVFNWPGLGSYAALSIRTLDVPAFMGVVLFVAIVYVLVNLLVDLLQAWLDPRIRIL